MAGLDAVGFGLCHRLQGLANLSQHGDDARHLFAEVRLLFRRPFPCQLLRLG